MDTAVVTLDYDLKLDTLEEVANFMNIPERFLKSCVASGVLYFNGFTETWWIKYQKELEEIEENLY